MLAFVQRRWVARSKIHARSQHPMYFRPERTGSMRHNGLLCPGAFTEAVYRIKDGLEVLMEGSR